MNSKLTFNETTYEFKYRLGIDVRNDAYEVFDIYIDGEKSIYHLEEGYVNTKTDDNKIYILLRKELSTGLDMGTGCDIKNPTKLSDLCKVIDKIIKEKTTQQFPIGFKSTSSKNQLNKLFNNKNK